MEKKLHGPDAKDTKSKQGQQEVRRKDKRKCQVFFSQYFLLGTASGTCDVGFKRKCYFILNTWWLDNALFSYFFKCYRNWLANYRLHYLFFSRCPMLCLMDLISVSSQFVCLVCLFWAPREHFFFFWVLCSMYNIFHFHMFNEI